jgi:hypothetical protein
MLTWMTSCINTRSIPIASPHFISGVRAPAKCAAERNEEKAAAAATLVDYCRADFLNITLNSIDSHSPLASNAPDGGTKTDHSLFSGMTWPQLSFNTYSARILDAIYRNSSDWPSNVLLQQDVSSIRHTSPI